MRKHRLVKAALVALACSGVGATSAAAQQEPPPTVPAPTTNGFAFDGAIHASLTAGSSTYVAGYFGAELPKVSTGLLAAAATGTGAVAPGAVPTVDGTVVAITDDGAGGLFIGGTFTKVGAVARRNLVHLKPDGTVDAAWNPSPDAPVTTLDRSGTSLAVGGDFTTIGGRSFGAPADRLEVAVVSTSTGKATAFTPPALADRTGKVSFDASGSRVYVSTGAYTDEGGDRIPHPWVRALDIATGAVLPWRPTLAEPNGFGFGIKVVAGKVILGATNFGLDRFGRITQLIGYDAVASGPPLWTRPDVPGRLTLVNGSDRVYVLPGLPDVGATLTPFALDPATGTTVWTAGVRLARRLDNAPTPTAGYLANGTLYVTGDFAAAGTATRLGAAAFNTTSGALTAWNPSVAAPGGRALHGLGGRVVFGGAFKAAGTPVGQVKDLARLKADGSLDAAFSFTFASFVDPSDYLSTRQLYVGALALDGTTLYVAGKFSAVDGKPRKGLAAIDTVTRAVTGFAPADSYQGIVRSLRVLPDRVEENGDGGLRAFTKAGTTIAAPALAKLELTELVAALDVPFATAKTVPFSSPYAGAVSVEASLPNGYVVGTGSAPVTAFGPADVTITLNDAGKLIRSVYPTFDFVTKATLTPADGAPITVG